jgi:hypothetical protein
MIGATVQQDVQVGQTTGPCQHSCLRSDDQGDRFRFVAVSQRTASKYSLQNTMPVSTTQCLLLARYAETHFRSCNINSDFAFLWGYDYPTI